jgi:CubicO group peptidase (beta-lactamase class C family)
MQHMLALVFCLLAAAPMAAAQPVPSAFGEATQDRSVPGMAYLVIRNYEVAEEAAWGRRRIDRPDPIRQGDRWHLGSDTKPMTATLVARLVDEGRLSWTARLDEMLPELAGAMRPEYRDVTLQDLLSHRSGLPENVSDQAFFNSFYDDRRPLPSQRLAYVTRALSEVPSALKRGEKSYSNTGYLLAAVIAERAAGRSYEDLMRDKVFSPLGMSTAGFDYRSGGPMGHVDGRVADQKYDPNPAMFAPAGQAQMSLRDWARFCIDAMQGGRGKGRLLKAQTYRFIQTGQGGTHNGLGFGISPTVVGYRGPALTHSGSDGNWFALVVLFPETGNGVLAVGNAAESMGGDKATSALLKAELARLGQPAV